MGKVFKLTTGLSVSLLWSLAFGVLLSSNASVASAALEEHDHEKSFCLSGGFRNAYSCDSPLVASMATSDSFYSVQLLQQKGEFLLPEDKPAAYEAEVEDGKHLVYFGHYDTRAEGLEGLQEAIQAFGAERYPLLVEVTLYDPLPRIRLITEPEETTQQLAMASSSDNADVSAAVSEGELEGESIFAIQLAALRQVDDAAALARELEPLPMTCRRKDNGLFAVYYGHYDSRKAANARLNDNARLGKMGAYVVQLPPVEFSQCNLLARQHKQTAPGKYASTRTQADTQSAMAFVDEVLKGDSVGQTSSSELTADELNALDGDNQHVSGQASSALSAQPPAAPIKSLALKDGDYDLVYAIQVAALSSQTKAQRFAARNESVPLVCRRKDNGLYALYYGLYETDAAAREHTKDYPLLAKQGAYVVKLKNVSFEACTAASMPQASDPESEILEVDEVNEGSMPSEEPSDESPDCDSCSALEQVNQYLEEGKD